MSEYIRTQRIIIALLAFIAVIPTAAADPANDAKPNIVLILMDNFGYGEVGVYGGGVLRGAATPNIDSIAEEGFQLTNFNVEALHSEMRQLFLLTQLDSNGFQISAWVKSHSTVA